MGVSKSKNRSFTLIELLVVVAIIAVLVAVLVPAQGIDGEASPVAPPAAPNSRYSQ